MPANRLRIAEIFYSIQGEGELSGLPSVFIRTSGCNLRCRWCDTKYASWNPQGEHLSIEQILEAVERYPTRYCVLTGGEPMLAPGIHSLAQKLRQLGYHITIETAGTLAPAGIPCDLASLSPKLANSRPDISLDLGAAWQERHEKLRLQPAILLEWLENYPYQIKFVIEKPNELQEIETLVIKIGKTIPPEKIFLMPEGVEQQALEGRQPALVDLCLKRGYRYSHRLHIQLFGNTPGT